MDGEGAGPSRHVCVCVCVRVVALPADPSFVHSAVAKEADEKSVCVGDKGEREGLDGWRGSWALETCMCVCVCASSRVACRSQLRPQCGGQRSRRKKCVCGGQGGEGGPGWMARELGPRDMYVCVCARSRVACRSQLHPQR